MHLEDQVKYKKVFFNQLEAVGWFNYINAEKKTTERVNVSFKLLHILLTMTILGLAFASMKMYIPRIYGYAALFLAVCWLFVERINLTKIDNYFLSSARKKIVTQLKNDESMMENIKLFDKHGLVPDNTYLNIHNVIEKEELVKLIKEIKIIITYLQWINEDDLVEKVILMEDAT
jgi:DNA-directed RNA polymerase subunit H (RpoH/RPB5)